MWDEPLVRKKRQITHLLQKPEKVLIHIDSRTVAMKSESAKKCVTTYLPNGLVLKMDDA